MLEVFLPNGKNILLDENISLEDKIKKTEELTEIWSDEISKNWHSNSVKYFLDSLSNYLVWHKEEEDKIKKTEDKYVLSRKKIEKMVKFKKTSKQVNFTDLSKDDKDRLFGN